MLNRLVSPAFSRAHAQIETADMHRNYSQSRIPSSLEADLRHQQRAAFHQQNDIQTLTWLSLSCNKIKHNKRMNKQN